MTASPHSPLQDDADAPVSVIKDECPPDNAGAPAPRSAFDRDGEVNR